LSPLGPGFCRRTRPTWYRQRRTTISVHDAAASVVREWRLVSTSFAPRSRGIATHDTATWPMSNHSREGATAIPPENSPTRMKGEHSVDLPPKTQYSSKCSIPEPPNATAIPPATASRRIARPSGPAVDKRTEVSAGLTRRSRTQPRSYSRTSARAGFPPQNEVDDCPIVAVVSDADIRPVAVGIEADDYVVVRNLVRHEQAGRRRSASAAAASSLSANQQISTARCVRVQIQLFEAIELVVHERHLRLHRAVRRTVAARARGPPLGSFSCRKNASLSLGPRHRAVEQMGRTRRLGSRSPAPLLEPQPENAPQSFDHPEITPRPSLWIPLGRWNSALLSPVLEGLGFGR
jgi:hypothetical protein